VALPMMGLMNGVSRPLIALLVGTVAFFALWIVALKPHGSSSGTSSQGLGSYQSAINKAHQAVTTSAQDNARAGGDVSTSPSTASAPPSTSDAASHSSQPKPATASTTAPHTAPGSPARHASTSPAATQRLSTVQRALSSHKVLALLFFNPAAPDDQAVKHELAAIPTHKGKVVKLTVPVNEAANYTAVTQRVPVNFTPTLVLVSPDGQANEIVGYSDQFEISQRVSDALATK
jgi:hypothetical protein